MLPSKSVATTRIHGISPKSGDSDDDVDVLDVDRSVAASESLDDNEVISPSNLSLPSSFMQLHGQQALFEDSPLPRKKGARDSIHRDEISLLNAKLEILGERSRFQQEQADLNLTALRHAHSTSMVLLEREKDSISQKLEASEIRAANDRDAVLDLLDNAFRIVHASDSRQRQASIIQAKQLSSNNSSLKDAVYSKSIELFDVIMKENVRLEADFSLFRKNCDDEMTSLKLELLETKKEKRLSDLLSASERTEREMLEQRLSSLKLIQKDNEAMISHVTQRGVIYNNTIDTANRLQQVNDDLRMELAAKEKICFDYMTADRKQKSDIDSLQQEKVLLIQDRNHFKLSSDGLTDKLNYCTDIKTSLEEELTKQRRLNHDLMDRPQSAIPDDIRDAITHLRNGDRSRDSINGNLNKELYEREVRVLKESIDLLSRERNELKLDLKERVQSHESMLITNYDEINKREMLMMELRNQLKEKCVEVNHLLLAHEDDDKEICQLKSYYQAEVEKNQVLLTEFSRLELSSHEEINNMKNEILILQDKLSAYEMMEDEIDKNIESGRTDANLNTALRSSTVGRRRIELCVKLSQKLSQTEDRLRDVDANMRQMDAALTNEQERRNQLELIINDIKQPSRFIVDRLMQKDAEINGLNVKCRQALACAEKLSNDLNHANNELKNSHDDVNKLLHEIEDINKIKSVLMAIRTSVNQPDQASLPLDKDKSVKEDNSVGRSSVSVSSVSKSETLPYNVVQRMLSHFSNAASK